ncbi:hypothetical protein ACOI1H_24805 [Loktanella sp. DJP18]|uniref:hypothetical protein n=1 Tax=Loktanella sp. DJP18 TaxID=3409788 RepID=UPI003BB6DCD1
MKTRLTQTKRKTDKMSKDSKHTVQDDDEEDLLDFTVIDDLDELESLDDDVGAAAVETPLLSPIQHVELLFHQILSTDARLPPGSVSIIYSKMGEGILGSGLDLNIMQAQDATGPENATVDLVVERAIAIALVLAGTLYGTRDLSDKYPQGISLDLGVTPTLSNHERMEAMESLKARMYDQGLNAEDMTTLLSYA